MRSHNQVSLDCCVIIFQFLLRSCIFFNWTTKFLNVLLDHTTSWSARCRAITGVATRCNEIIKRQENSSDSQHDSLLNTIGLWEHDWDHVCYDTMSCQPLPFEVLLSDAEKMRLFNKMF